MKSLKQIAERIRTLQDALNRSNQTEKNLVRLAKEAEAAERIRVSAKVSAIANELTPIRREITRLEKLERKLQGRINRYNRQVDNIGRSILRPGEDHPGILDWLKAHDMKLEIGRLTREVAKRIVRS